MKSIKWMVASALVLIASATTPKQACAQAEGFIGEIRMFAGDFAPKGWAFCDGQMLAISQNSALFSILQTTYGGNGMETFALPDLRGRAPIHQGQGPGLKNRTLGEKTGADEEPQTKLTTTTKKVLVPNPAAADKKADPAPYLEEVITIPVTAQVTTGKQPVQAINFIICTRGIFPSRD